MSLSDLIYMGGYGAFVWPSYGFFMLVLVINLVAAQLKRKTTLKMLKQLSHIQGSSNE